MRIYLLGTMASGNEPFGYPLKSCQKFLVLLESPWRVRFNRIYFIIFRVKVWRILIFGVNFCCWKFLIIANIGFGRKNQLSPNVFTLEPTAEATLVGIDS